MYTMELVWIMSKYRACSLEVIEKLLATPTIKRHVGANERLQSIITEWREKESSQVDVQQV